MRCSHCGICCTETEMLLSNEDIKRLEKRGFHKKYFVKIFKDGYAQLKNRNGYCVFYDSEIVNAVFTLINLKVAAFTP